MSGASEAARDAACEGLKRSSGFLKKRLGGELKLKYMPELTFFYDEAVDVEEKIDELLKGSGNQA